MKKILIIAYFYPPCANSGAHRPLKMVTYLPQLGWEPIVLTVARPHCYRFDQNLLSRVEGIEVVRTGEFFLFRNKRTKIAKAWFRIWRYLSCIDAHSGWILFAVLAGRKILKKNKIDAIFATGYPYSSYFIGYILKLISRKPLFIDYRDPWLSNPGFVKGRPKWFLKWLEKLVLFKCNLFFGATPAIVTDVGRKYDRIIKSKGRTFTYSYDPNEFKQSHSHPKGNDPGKYKFLVIGNAYDQRVGDNFVEAVSRLIKENGQVLKNMVFELYGNLKFTRNRINDSGLAELIIRKEIIPHQEIVKKMAESNGLILPHGSGPCIDLCYPGRMFEFFAASKPILYLGVDGIAAEAIRDSGMGLTADSNDVDELKNKLLEFIERSIKNTFIANNDFIRQFEVSAVMKRFVSEIDSFGYSSE